MGKYAQAMNNGGMADDGIDVAPNGNEVPPGSLANEVEDNVDIKVSGGEYIVPADVTQYYGVKFFENLRERAKRGLMEMESNGRIGGQPAPPVESGEEVIEEELPFADEELMVEGGDARYAVGGQVPTYQAPVGSRPNLSFNRGAVPTGPEYKTYENAEGTTRTILFMGGRPVQAIPEGFYPEGQVPAAAKTGKADTGTVNTGGDSDMDQTRENLEREVRSGMEKFDPSSMTAEDMQKFANQRDVLGKGLKAVSLMAGGPFGLIVGGLVNQGMAIKNRQVYDEATARAAQALEAGDRETYELFSGVVNKLEDDQGGFLGKAIDRFLPQSTGTTAPNTTGLSNEQLSEIAARASGTFSSTTGTSGGTASTSSDRDETSAQTDIAFGDDGQRFSDTQDARSYTGDATDYSTGTEVSWEDRNKGSSERGGYSTGTPVDDEEEETNSTSSGGFSFGGDVPSVSFAAGGLVKKRKKRKR